MPTEINPKKKMVKSQAVPNPKDYKESKSLSEEVKEILARRQGADPWMTHEEQERSRKGTLSNNPEDEY